MYEHKKNPGKKRFHVNGFALSLTLKQRLEAYCLAYSLTRILVAREIVCYTAVFRVVTQRSSPGGELRDDCKNSCVADYQRNRMCFSGFDQVFLKDGPLEITGGWGDEFFLKARLSAGIFSRAYNLLFLGITACRIFFRQVSLAGIFVLGIVTPPVVISNGPPLRSYLFRFFIPLKNSNNVAFTRLLKQIGLLLENV